MDGYIEKLELELRSRGFSGKTIKSYVFHVSRFLRCMTPEAPDEEIRRYFVDLSLRADARTVNLGISAVKFFYRNILLKELEINYMKRPKRLPEVLTTHEVESILSSVYNTKHRLLLEMIYGCGLRVSEAAGLKIQDLRFQEGVLYLREAKGKKDRAVSLPSSIKDRLVAYLALRNDDNPYVFESARGGRLTVNSIQKIMKKAAKRARIRKCVHPHTLRHSYATHLLENGTDIRIIQRLLGHNDVRTTEIYTHISTALIKSVRSPLDSLELENKGNTIDEEVCP